MVETINQIPGLSCRKPEGAFYVFANLSGLIGKKCGEKTITDSDVFAGLLLEKGNVAVVPGSGFGAPEYIRLSYTTSMAKIKEGLERIKRFIEMQL
jgi:aspartate aminotransferase